VVKGLVEAAGMPVRKTQWIAVSDSACSVHRSGIAGVGESMSFVVFIKEFAA